MSYYATCSFDLTHGATREDYTNAYADLAAVRPAACVAVTT